MQGDSEPTNNNKCWSESELEQKLLTEHYKKNSSSAKRKAYWKGKHPLEWGIGILVLLTLLATSAAAVYTARESGAVHKQTKIMGDQEQRQLRAYVFAVPHSGNEVKINLGQPIDIDIPVKNSGLTPAYDVSVSICFAFDTENFSPPTKFDGPCVKQVGQGGSLPPGDSEKQAMKFIFAPSQTVWNEIGNVRSIDVWYWGRIDYKDIFLQHWFSNFCFYYTGVPGKIMQMAYCNKHQEAE